MARRDLSNEEIEEMGRVLPGSAAKYLELRRAELQAEKKEALEKEDRERFIAEFEEAGGTSAGARKAYDRLRDEEAEKAARTTEMAGRESVRSRISGAL
jgi:hypothetical protein